MSTSNNRNNKERVALAMMNADPQGYYRGCVRAGLKLSDINAEVREMIAGRYLVMAEVALRELGIG